MNTQTRSSIQPHGSAIVVAILTIAILSIAAVGVLSQVGSKYRNLSQATSWRKALVAAESGVDFGMQKLTDSITDPVAAWTGWTTTDPATGQTLPYSGKAYTATALTFAGEGGNSMNFQVIVDTPPGLAAGSRTKQYYRIRSTGYADIPGTKVVTNSSLDVNLRKLSLRRDRKTGVALTKPRASRIIEIIAAPETEMKPRNVAHAKWDMQNWKSETIGFDSTDPNYSTVGRYDPTKKVPADQAGMLLATNQWNPDGAKLGTIERVDLKSATIWGDFGLVAGSVDNGQNVKGETFTEVYTALPKVLPPTWTTLTDPSITKIEGKPTNGQKTAYAAWYAGASAQMKGWVDPSQSVVLRGNASSSTPSTYKVTRIMMDKKNESLVLANPTGVTESWIEIWVTDEFNVTEAGTIAVENGVHATVHFEKSLKVTDTKKDNGGAFVESGFAGDLIFRGIEQAEADKVTDADFSPIKTSGLVEIKDNSFTGVVYGPDYDMELMSRNPLYPATQQYILGAVTGRKVRFHGDTDFVTDLSLTQSGRVITGYKIASWFEDSE